jgi:2'-hydroxyisoflavone reductase
MRILILGGTVFLGRALVRAAQGQGHEVSILTRGRSGTDPDGVQVFRGDRADADGLGALDDHTFDVVIDTSRQAVSHVRRAVEELANRTGRYVFTSTVSVYASLAQTGLTESSPTVDPLWTEDPAEEDDLDNYPALNVACEQVVRDALGNRALVVRPGLIVGDHDPTDRFGYWPARLSRGGDVLAPGNPETRVQFVDVRDLAEFVVRAAHDDRSGTFNVCGPGEPLSMRALLDTCQEHPGTDSRLVWVDDAFLVEHGLRPYLDLPLWIPEDPDDAGFSAVDCSRATSAGLAFRPVTDTVAVALRTERALGLDRERRAGLSPGRELELLAAWRT